MGRERKTPTWLGVSACLAFTCICFLMFQSRSAFGQVDEGSISGTVQDTSGAVIPNAQVTLLNTDQGITLETKTSSSGGYTFSPVRIGHYTVTVTAQGFAKTTQKNLTVNVAQFLEVNVQLKLGAATETVCRSMAATSPSLPNLAPECKHRRPIPEVMQHPARSLPTDFARRRITTFSMASTITPTRSTS